MGTCRDDAILVLSGTSTDDNMDNNSESNSDGNSDGNNAGQKFEFRGMKLKKHVYSTNFSQ